ncbi:MAG TPA: copper homeostasis membrane protein CopD [Usitatibacter sp.]|jgi:putative copper resistance protein D|nr:copper homeostasis membrane protein CopD [Usitatibacter sp.]
MEALLTIVRALHFAAVIVLFGQFAFAAFVSPDGRLPARFASVAWASLVLAALTACAWLAIESVNMSGLSPIEALGRTTLETVLFRTQFGRVWIGRALVMAILCAVLAAAGGRRRNVLVAFGGTAALILLASIACAGHAAADPGADRYAHGAADALHLVAAGAWLGALVPFTALLAAAARDASADAIAQARIATHRFSVLGVASVGTLAVTGIVNTCYMVPNVQALFHSRYGLELVAKLCLVVLVLALAADNRLRLTGRLDTGASGAAGSLFRNACVEVLLGFAIVSIVGNLGITMPPMAMAAH